MNHAIRKDFLHFDQQDLFSKMNSGEERIPYILDLPKTVSDRLRKTRKGNKNLGKGRLKFEHDFRIENEIKIKNFRFWAKRDSERFEGRLGKENEERNENVDQLALNSQDISHFRRAQLEFCEDEPILRQTMIQRSSRFRYRNESKTALESFVNVPDQSLNPPSLPTVNSDENPERLQILNFNSLKFGIKRVKLESKPKIENEQEIQNSKPFFQPFSRAWMSVQNYERKYKFKTSAFCLNRLRQFFRGMFTFELSKTQIFGKISNFESRILLKVFELKPYLQKDKILACFRNTNWPENLGIFHEMQRKKRKEENLKFSFRILIKFLQEEFRNTTLRTVVEDDSPLSSKNETTLFYLSFFSKQDMGLDFRVAAQQYLSETRFKCNYFKKMSKFIFPDNNNRNQTSKFRSYSRKFFASISKSQSLIDKLNNLLLLGFFSISLWRKYIGERPFLKDWRLSEGSTQKRVMFLIAEQNDTELGKMVSEWENLIQKELKSFKSQLECNDSFILIVDQECETNKNLEDSIVSNIHKNISKPNFKFMWSLSEIKNAFLDGILSLNELAHVPKVKGMTRKKSKNSSKLLIYKTLWQMLIQISSEHYVYQFYF